MLIYPPLLLEGGTYTPTGRTFYKNLTELAWFVKEFHLDLKLPCLRPIHDIFIHLCNIFFFNVLSNQVFVFIVFVNKQIHFIK